MAYRVEFSETARRQFRRLGVGVRSRVERKLQELANDPRPGGAEKMAGNDLGYRLRVGDYRVIYELEDDVLLVLVSDSPPAGRLPQPPVSPEFPPTPVAPRPVPRAGLGGSGRGCR